MSSCRAIQSAPKTCQSCGAAFGCGAPCACWCDQVPLDAASRAALQRRFTDCLCPACLEAVAATERHETRVATAADAGAIADAHRDSIRTLGSAFYAADAIADWQDAVTGDLYLQAMDRGEVFFVTCAAGQPARVLGFSSDYPIGGTLHGTSVYVRGSAARRGIGSALLRRAEGLALERGATDVQIEASLSGLAFYAANGFAEVGRSETHLPTGRPLACVVMRKALR
jgi:GNAT superfamily N-acetyltransferase